MFEYFIIHYNGIIFPQETHSLEDTFNEWRDNFKGEGVFLHSTTNSYVVMMVTSVIKFFQLIKLPKAITV